MTTKTRTARNWKEERAAIWSSIAYISESRNVRASNAVVVLINQFGQGEPRTVVMRTGGFDERKRDFARCARLCRRLRAIGVHFNTRIEGTRECDGLFGTMFAYKLAA
jgi:hypothetical protein